MGLAHHVFNEVELFSLFSRRDWTGVIVPSCLFAAGPALTLPLNVALPRCLFVVAWTCLYLYAFNLANQSLGDIVEDRINKPHRPIPSGRVSLRGARARCAVVWALFLSTALFYRTIWRENLTHLVISLFLVRTRAGGHWIGKNVVGISLLGAVMLSAPRKIMMGTSLVGSQTMTTTTTTTAAGTVLMGTENDVVAICVWLALSYHVQDFRDQAGDKAVGRSTLPIAFGDVPARLVYTFVFMPVGLAVVCAWGPGGDAPWLVAAMHAFVGYRLLAFHDKDADDWTYKILLYIFCVLAALGSVRYLRSAALSSSVEATMRGWGRGEELRNWLALGVASPGF
ncbi:hypothetical protein JDV02_010252 [Purpureocillium takamizusanense]|uniref:UbiA prenyltransferase n=1 Tax=Purpureocillium takamizusanense TaxID=2060973 RepID=A0A9Q8VGD1_9HYPO|nr:uncharacterized protein JDV02_010252 [Purpureocillium takamizusanense]UNI24513.1 hypothetical protein JDV02_010252 [Purpureocillium takamizusanense]